MGRLTRLDESGKNPDGIRFFMRECSIKEVAISSGWWVSISESDVVLAASGGEGNFEREGEPDNLPQEIDLFDALDGLTPRFGWRDLEAGAFEANPPRAEFVAGSVQEEARVMKRVPSPELTYARQLEIPSEWAGRRLYLRLDFTRYRVRLCVNGQVLAEYIGGLEPHEVALPESVQAGDRMMVVITVGDSGTSGHRNFDAYAFTGTRLPTCREIESNLVHPVIYGGSDRAVGDVRLLGKIPVRADSVLVIPKVSEGKLAVKAWLKNETETSERVRWICRVEGGPRVTDEVVEISPGAVLQIEREVRWDDARCWDLEDPYLYELKTSLAWGEGNESVRTDRFGYREFAINGPDFFLNGTRIHLFGQSGHTEQLEDSRTTLEEKVAILKAWKEDGRINHLRLHAKPQHPDWVEAADRVGLLITTETALWTTGFHSFDWAGSEEACYANVRNHFLEALVRRDRNNPSVVIWSLSNEMSPIIPSDLDNPKMSAMTRVFDRILSEAREEDPTRVIQMSSAVDFLGRLDVYNLHYPKNWQAFPDYPHTAYWMETPFLFPWFGSKRETMPEWSWRRDKPLIFGEFTCVFGVTPDNQAAIVGDVAFEDEDFGTAKVNEKLWPMEIHAYRREGVSGFTAWSAFWFFDLKGTLSRLEEPYVKAHSRALRPLAVLSHDYRTRLFAGASHTVPLSVHNDSRAAGEFSYAVVFRLDGNTVSEVRTAPSRFEPGEIRRSSAACRLPLGVGGTLSMEVTMWGRGGGVADHWSQEWEVADPALREELASEVAVVDLGGGLSETLTQAGIADFDVLREVPMEKKSSGSVFVSFADSPFHRGDWAVWRRWLEESVTAGAQVILDRPPGWILEDLPVKLQNGRGFATGSRLEITYAFVSAPCHPAIRGLDDRFFSLWGGDYYVARSCFAVPQEGNAVPLLVAGTDRAGLVSSPLLELRSGKGRWVASTLELIPKLGEEPAARIFFQRLVEAGRVREILVSAACSVEPESLRVLREVGFPGRDVTPREALESACGLIDAARVAGDQDFVADLKSALARGRTVVLHGFSVEQTREILGALQISASVAPHPGRTVGNDTIRHVSPLADGMTSGSLYWIVDKARVAPWTRAPLHPSPASCVIADGQTGAALTKLGAVVAFEVGPGTLVLDALFWQDSRLDEPERARRYLVPLLTNLGFPLREGEAKRHSEDYETEAERRERGHF